MLGGCPTLFVPFSSGAVYLSPAVEQVLVLALPLQRARRWSSPLSRRARSFRLVGRQFLLPPQPGQGHSAIGGASTASRVLEPPALPTPRQPSLSPIAVQPFR